MDKSDEIPFYVPWITRVDRKAVYDSLKSRWLTGGPQAKKLEEMFAQYVGVKYAVAVNSCTAALHLSMRVLNVKAGDEVIVPDLTFAATANAPLFCGAQPVFADVDEKTFCISPDDVMERITQKTKAIIPMHYGGQPCNMKEILEIAEDHKLFVVEDCAHSLGATYAGQQTGTFGATGCFSFYPTKIITTLEGGMVTTDDERIDKRLRVLREHGMDRNALERESSSHWSYDVVDLGYNYRLPEALAALGIAQMKRIDQGIKRRIRAASCYTKLLSKRSIGVITPYSAENRSHIFHLYTIRIKKNLRGMSRNEVFNRLRASGIQSSVHYTPLHLMSFYSQFLSQRSRRFPVAEKVFEEILSLPLYPTLSYRDVKRVTSEIEALLD